MEKIKFRGKRIENMGKIASKMPFFFRKGVSTISNNGSGLDYFSFYVIFSLNYMVEIYIISDYNGVIEKTTVCEIEDEKFIFNFFLENHHSFSKDQSAYKKWFLEVLNDAVLFTKIECYREILIKAKNALIN